MPTLTIEEIQDGVRDWDYERLMALRSRIQEYAEDLWDKHIEEDTMAGRLDWLLEEARNDICEGRTTPL